MPETVGYLLMFTGIGVAFVLVNLTVGWFLRPSKMDAEKGTIYECGEPTVGSAWVQFDLRFYVVALLFVIFDVEVAFFFPWAEVFGRSNALAAARQPANAQELNDYARAALALVPDYKDREDEVLRERYRRWEALDQAAFEAM